MDENNLNYLNTEGKQSYDAILTLHSLEIVNIPPLMHSKTIIKCFITDLNSTELKNNVFVFIPLVKTDHLGKISITELNLIDKTMSFKCTIYDRSKFLEKKFETALASNN